MEELSAIILYFAAVFSIGFFSYSKNLDSSGFIIGNRSLNYWVTALAAHASDMSSWLFMAYPAMIFLFGLHKIWIAVGLIICMYCNWQFIAPKIRVITEKFNCLTFFSYLEHQFHDKSGLLRIFSALVCFVFYTIYISAGLVGLGLLVESLFNLSYHTAISISILTALPYVLIGGYRTLAWIDLFQGLFLMLIIVFVPVYLLLQIGGWETILTSAASYQIPMQLMPDLSAGSFLTIILVMLGWGIGYFGQPAIITKFMGIKHVSQIHKSKFVGMSWMIISLLAATLVGLVGIPFFQGTLSNPEMIFIKLVQQSFSPFFIGLILCAIFAASTNVMCSQILVLTSSVSEDIYKKLWRKKASSKELLHISRVGVLFVSLIAYLIAYFKISSIYSLVLYAWSGLGASFGPLLIFSLYSKRLNKKMAWAGILSGSISSALWPWINTHFAYQIDPIIIGFACSFAMIWITAFFTKEKATQLSIS